MTVLEKFNPNQLVPVDTNDNKKVRLKFSDGTIRLVPEFLLVGVLKDGHDIAYCMWRHTDKLFYINWMRRNRINSTWFQYLETLEDDEFRDALKSCHEAEIIKIAMKDLIWIEGNEHGFDPTTISYEIHPSLYQLPSRDTKSVDYFRRGKPVHSWGI